MLAFVFLVVTFYYLFLSCVALFPYRKQKINFSREMLKKFVVVIPAHNEQDVIKRSIRSIKQANPYAKIIVIADNCNDDTEAIARRLGANVWIRTDATKKGKQYAVKWALDRLLPALSDDTYITFFDADNYVDSLYFKQIIPFLSRYDVVQGYIATYNPYDSLNTAYYAVAYNFMNRAIYLARQRLGFHAVLGGTGWTVKASVLKKVPFNVTSLVDDLEYSVLLRLANIPIGFCPTATTYDEKPYSFVAGLRQRLRWARGQWQVFLKYWWRVLFKDLELFLYISFPVLGLFVLYAVCTYGLSSQGIFIFVVWYAVFNILEGAFPVLGLLVLPFYVIIQWFLNLYALFTYRNYTWKRTQHRLEAGGIE